MYPFYFTNCGYSSSDSGFPTVPLAWISTLSQTICFTAISTFFPFSLRLDVQLKGHKYSEWLELRKRRELEASRIAFLICVVSCGINWKSWFNFKNRITEQQNMSDVQINWSFAFCWLLAKISKRSFPLDLREYIPVSRQSKSWGTLSTIGIGLDFWKNISKSYGTDDTAFRVIFGQTIRSTRVQSAVSYLAKFTNRTSQNVQQV